MQTQFPMPVEKLDTVKIAATVKQMLAQRPPSPTQARDSQTVRAELHRTTEPCERFINNLADARHDLKAVRDAIALKDARVAFLRSEACSLSPNWRDSELQELEGYDFLGADRLTTVHHDGPLQILHERRVELERTVARLERAVKAETARLKVAVPALKAELKAAMANEGMTPVESQHADQRIAAGAAKTGNSMLDNFKKD